MSMMRQPTSTYQEVEKALVPDIEDLMERKERNRGNKSDNEVEEEDSGDAMYRNAGKPGDDGLDDDDYGEGGEGTIAATPFNHPTLFCRDGEDRPNRAS
jgi:hypothetical protein